jgi:hypothetical protein
MLSVDNVLGLVGLIAVVSSDKWQCIGDMTAGTEVVRADSHVDEESG